MRMSRWSNYSKYIVMIDKVHGLTIKTSYSAYLDFKKVKEALYKISNSGSDIYLYNDNTYTKPITSEQARDIIEGIDRCKWSNDIKKVIRQIDLTDILLPK